MRALQKYMVNIDCYVSRRINTPQSISLITSLSSIQFCWYLVLQLSPGIFFGPPAVRSKRQPMQKNRVYSERRVNRSSVCEIVSFQYSALQQLAELIRRVRGPRLLGTVTLVRRLLAFECCLLLRIPAQTQSSPEARSKQDNPPRENDWQVAVHPVHAAIRPYGHENLV